MLERVVMSDQRELSPWLRERFDAFTTRDELAAFTECPDISFVKTI